MPALSLDAHYLRNAHTLARLARAAYFANPLEKYPELETQYTRMAQFRHGRISTLVVSNDTQTAIAFRGTDDDTDWLESMSYRQIPWITGKAHAGFVRSLEAIWMKLLAALYDAGSQEKTLWITGHSLGGALAVLATHRLAHEGFNPHTTFIFGTPRVFDPAAAKSFSTPLYRFMNNEDPVPNIPWPSPLDTYAHAGRPIFILASGAIAKSRHSKHLARKIDRAHSIGEGILPSGMVHDHLLVSYIEKLEKASRLAEING